MKSNTVQFNHETIKYDGKLSELARLWYKNLFLSILTLGIYRFWGKTRLRQYLIGCHSLAGERFVYTGTSDELFNGFFRAVLFLIPFLAMIVINVVYNTDLSFFAFLYGLYLAKYFAYGRLQYLNGRTKWQGIHGSLKGSRASFAKKQFFSTIFSFGLLIPYIATERRDYIMKHYTFGGMDGAFDNKPHKLVSRRFYSRLLAIPTLGYSLAWYARLRNEYLYNNSKIGNVQLAYTASTGQIYKFFAQNILLFLVTLGLATPVIVHKTNQFKSKYISFIGNVDIDKLVQHSASIDAKFDDGASLVSDGFDLSLG